MDYKISVLPQAIELKDSLIEDFSDLLFGTTPDGTPVFDATEYCNRVETESQFNARVFMRNCKPFIEGFIKAGELDPSKMFYQNTDGHSLIHEQLVYLFLMFTSNVWLIYFNSLISDVINTGVAYSDSFLLKQAIQRIPSDVMEKIIETRKEDEQSAAT
jgi:hypothetical protein